jgi:hypothetical protein
MIPVEPGRRTKRKRKREGRGGGKRGEKKEGNYDLGGQRPGRPLGRTIFLTIIQSTQGGKIRKTERTPLDIATDCMPSLLRFMNMDDDDYSVISKETKEQQAHKIVARG